MRFKGPLLVTSDMEAARRFYSEVLGLETEHDFGANVALTGGIYLQTKESWREFIGAPDEKIAFFNNDAELYFEEEDFDAFVKKLLGFPCVRYVHPVFEHRWGQRVLRIYDPDGHIVEVGEPLAAVCRRFMAAGLTPEETAARMDVPVGFVQNCLA
jgi:catechol 2,3-dioxygenase-like lactoylglutathione lyase family enzyme